MIRIQRWKVLLVFIYFISVCVYFTLGSGVDKEKQQYTGELIAKNSGINVHEMTEYKHIYRLEDGRVIDLNTSSKNYALSEIGTRYSLMLSDNQINRETGWEFLGGFLLLLNAIFMWSGMLVGMIVIFVRGIPWGNIGKWLKEDI